jgi:hypothetical protein
LTWGRLLLAFASIHPEESPVQLGPHVSEILAQNSSWTTRRRFAMHAMTEFLLEVDPRTPPYWYSVFGEGPGSLSYFFGMKEDVFIEVLVAAEVLKQHGETLCFQWEKFYAGFNFLVGGRPKSIEAEQSKLDNLNIKVTHNTKGQRKVQLLIRVGSSMASRSYQPLDPRLRKVESQVKAGLPPPRASLNLSRRLFMECESIRNILLVKEPNPDAQKSAARHDFAAKPKDPPEQAKYGSSMPHSNLTICRGGRSNDH